MKLTKGAVAKAMQGALASGKRMNSAQVTKALQSAGIDIRHNQKEKMSESQLKTAFKTLKDKGLLGEKVQSEGLRAFTGGVKDAVVKASETGISKEQQQGHAKALLRERMAEDDAKQKKITEALGFGKKADEGAAKGVDRRSSAGHSGPAVVGGVVAGQAERNSAPQAVVTSLGGEQRYRPGSNPLTMHKAPPAEEPPDMFGPDE